MNSTIPAKAAPKPFADYAAIWIPILLFVGAVIIRLIKAGDAPVAGDELGSMQEARVFTNLHALSYFLSLNLWLRAGDGTIWLRLLTIIPASLAVPLTWAWIRAIRGRDIALVAAILLMLSPLAVEYAREIRFYGMYLFSSAVLMWAYTRIAFFHERSPRARDWALLGVGLVLTLTSHLLGTLLVALLVVHAIVINFSRIPRTLRIAFVVVTLAGTLAVIAMLIFPNLFASIYVLIRRISASPSYQSYPGGRGLGLITLGKLAILYLAFTLGQFVPPLDLITVVPVLLVLTVAALGGLIRLFRLPSKRAVWLAGLVIGGSVVALFIVFDSLWPSTSRDSAVPNYIIFALPLLLWVVAEGVLIPGSRVLRVAGIAAVIATQVVGLVYLYNADWSVTYKAIRLNEPSTVLHTLTPQMGVQVVTDGRSNAVIKYYLRDTAIPVSTLDSGLPPAGKVFLTSYDDRAEIRCLAQPALNQLAARRPIYGWVNYPFFVYGWDQSAGPDPSSPEVPLPRSLYGIEYSDLRLPQTFTWKSTPLTVGGMYSLPGCDKSTSLKSDVPQGGQTASLLLASNLINAGSLADGTVIAHMVVTLDGGATVNFDIRKGMETQSWDGQCASPCQPVLTWRKRLALLGASAYAGAYRDFTATIFGAPLTLPGPSIVRSVTITSVQPDAAFNIWGLYSLPTN